MTPCPALPFCPNPKLSVHHQSVIAQPSTPCGVCGVWGDSGNNGGARRTTHLKGLLAGCGLQRLQPALHRRQLLSVQPEFLIDNGRARQLGG